MDVVGQVCAHAGVCPQPSGCSTACTSGRYRYWEPRVVRLSAHRACSSGRPCRRCGARRRRTDSRPRRCRTRCRHRLAPRRCRTRCGTARQWAHVQASGVGAVLAHVGRHQPAELRRVRRSRTDSSRVRSGRRAQARHAEADQSAACLPRLVDALAALLDEGGMPPGAGAQRAGVVVGRPKQLEVTVARVVVPLLAGDLAGLAADADRGVGEEALARLGVRPPRVGRGVGRSGELTHQPSLLGSWYPGGGSMLTIASGPPSRGRRARAVDRRSRGRDR